MRDSKWIKPVNALGVILLLLPLLTGCWDRQEIEERALVLGIGIDLAGPGAEQEENKVTHLGNIGPEPKTGMVRITVQIAVPGRIPLGPGGGASGGVGGGGGQKTVWIIDDVGHTIDEAINNLQQKIAPPLFFGHLRAIIVSEALAKKGIDNMNEYLRRNPEVRRMNWMLICKGKAADYMRTIPEFERVPTIYMITMMDQAVKMGRFPNDFLGVFWSASSSKGQEGYLPYIELETSNTILLKGIAFFKADRMVGLTEPIEIPLFMGIKGLNPAGGQAFVQVPGTSQFAMYGGRNRKSTIRVQMVNGEPHIKVKIYIEGNFIEKSNESYVLNSQLLDQIDRNLEQESKKAYENLIKKTQEKGSDIFGFGEYIRAKQPAYWNREIHSKAKWQQAYKDLPVEVSVSVHMRRVGMKAK